ncbi:hypothetical protein [Microbacterium sp. NPDC056052]|uniref:hypothetical protein n=1 Tax=Microbacterium sp. NPDC056052 TaxID=3345695 RepID=UPI0035DB25E5
MGEQQEAEPATPGVAGAATRAASEARMAAWARKMTDRVPTGWLISGAGAVLLASTAAFGGLADVPKPKPAELRAGEHFVGSELDMSVVSAAIGSGEVKGAGVTPDVGEKTVVVVLDVTNEYTAPRTVRAKDTLGGIQLDGIETHRYDVNRVVDGSGASFLQPDVPTRVRIAWTVDGEAVSPGNEIRIMLPDSTRFTGSFVGRGEYWYDVRPGAYVTVTLDEIPSVDEEAP